MNWDTSKLRKVLYDSSFYWEKAFEEENPMSKIPHRPVYKYSHPILKEWQLRISRQGIPGCGTLVFASTNDGNADSISIPHEHLQKLVDYLQKEIAVMDREVCENAERTKDDIIEEIQDKLRELANHD